MDSKANIEEQTTLARAIVEQSNEQGRLDRQAAEHAADLAAQLAERVLALDERRRSGGFDPYG